MASLERIFQHTGRDEKPEHVLIWLLVNEQFWRTLIAGKVSQEQTVVKWWAQGHEWNLHGLDPKLHLQPFFNSTENLEEGGQGQRTDAKPTIHKHSNQAAPVYGNPELWNPLPYGIHAPSAAPAHILTALTGNDESQHFN